jgi:zinc/manganese transport system substrate-binding protein
MKTIFILGVATLTTVALAQSAPVNVSVSFSILEDLVKNVGRERVNVTSVVPRDGDAHSFQPSAADAKTVANARVIFVNGLGFEGWFEKLAKNANAKAPVVELAKGLPARKLEEEHHEGEAGHEGEAEHDHGKFDPHLWWNPMNTVQYVNRIRDALTRADQSGRAVYAQNASRYARELANLDAWAKTEVAKIPAAKRKIVTNHDALEYFAARYGFRIVGTVIPSGSTERAPSAKETAELIRVIRREGVKAIFTENVLNPKLAQTIASETDAKIAPALYTDALGVTGSNGETYLKAFRYNVTTIVNALR